ncbi:MAG: nitroreductase family deazaflavin-dependent oxidoreductase [Streptosporangiaceae bacterium]|nr:nitroreductase family deazaflavin-dependent oxidoreductase [Streptosporangiaceae bacterium]MBV9853531.1 nitroreductase family deazaflavin-dependent oxidoreductase [Streptosporangiaceae bacterium]
MGINGQQGTGMSAGALEPVPPSRLVRVIIRPLTKVLNPVMAKVTGRRHFGGAARLTHRGRRSGKPYVAIVGAHLTGDTAVIPLTFGNTSDWVRNVRAAGGCTIRLNGADYTLADPESRSAEDARPLVRAAFNPLFRAVFPALGIREFLVLRVVTEGSGAGSGVRPQKSTEPPA